MGYQVAVTTILLGFMACSALGRDIREKGLELMCKHVHHDPWSESHPLCERYRPAPVRTTQSTRIFIPVMPEFTGTTPRTKPVRFTSDITTGPTTTAESYRVTWTTTATATVGPTPGKDLAKFPSVEDITTTGTTPSSSTIPPASLSSTNVERGDFSTPYMNVFLVGIVGAVAGFLIYRYAGRAGMALVNCHLKRANRATVRCNNGLMSL